MLILQRIQRLTIHTILLLTPLVFHIGLEDCYYLPKLLVFEIAVAALLLSYFVSLLLERRKWSVPLDATHLALIAIPLYLALQFIWRGGAVNVRSFFLILSYVIFAAVCLDFFRAERERKRVLLPLFVAAVIAAIYALAQRLGGDLPGWLTDFKGRSFSSFGNPAFLGGYLVLLLPVAIWFLLTARSKWRYFAVGLTALLLAGLAASYTRGAWLGLAAGLPVFFVLYYYSRPEKRVLTPTVAMIGGLVLLALLAFPGNLARLVSIFDLFGEGAQGRFLMWRVTLAMIVDNPFLGIMPGSYLYLYPEYQIPLVSLYRYLFTGQAHNDYLQLLAEFGLVGFTLLLLPLWGLTRRLGQSWRERRPSGMEAALLGGLVALAVHALFNFPLYILPSAVAALLFFCMLHGSLTPARRVWSLPAFPVAGVMLLLLLALGVNLSGGVQRMTASYYLKQGGDLNREMEYTGAQRLLRRGIELNRGDYRLRRELAVSLAAVNMFGAAAGQLVVATERFPASAELWVRRGLMEARAGNLKDAEWQLREALRLDPGRQAAWNNLGNVYYKLGEKRRSAECFLQVAKLKYEAGDVEGSREAVAKAEAMRKELKIKK